MPYSGSNERLRTEVPQVIFTPVEEAIDRLYRWYEANLASIDRTALLVDR